MKALPKSNTTEPEECSSEAKEPEPKSEAEVNSGADKSTMHDQKQVLEYLDSLRKENLTLKKCIERRHLVKSMKSIKSINCKRNLSSREKRIQEGL